MEKLALNAESSITTVIAVMSGKGGVGKSSVAALLASSLHKRGLKVGVLDADITGASIPKMFGVTGKVLSERGQIHPALSKNGVKIMSLNLLLQKEDDPVIWRGPLIAGAVRQFWTDVVWGELDYLIIDSPPGTGDSPLTVMQSLPLDSLVIVTTPQQLTTMVVRKAVKMAEMMEVPITGLIENMSFLICPECGTQINLFGESNSAQVCAEHKIELLAVLPLEPQLAKLCDQGRVYDYANPAIEDCVCELIVQAN